MILIFCLKTGDEALRIPVLPAETVQLSNELHVTRRVRVSVSLLGAHNPINSRRHHLNYPINLTLPVGPGQRLLKEFGAESLDELRRPAQSPLDFGIFSRINRSANRMQ